MVDRFQRVAKPDDVDHLFEVRITTQRGGGRWSKPAVLWLRYHTADGDFELVGIEHCD